MACGTLYLVCRIATAFCRESRESICFSERSLGESCYQPVILWYGRYEDEERKVDILSFELVRENQIRVAEKVLVDGDNVLVDVETAFVTHYWI